jgi:hypothetical protein
MALRAAGVTMNALKLVVAAMVGRVEQSPEGQGSPARHRGWQSLR